MGQTLWPVALSTSAAVLLCYAQSAGAQPAHPTTTPPAPVESPSGVRRHDGFYLHMDLGPTYLSAQSSRRDTAATASDIHTISGAGTGAAIMVGGTPVPGFVIAGVVATEVAPAPGGHEEESGSDFELDFLWLSSVGLALDIYPLPDTGLHFQPMIARTILVVRGAAPSDPAGNEDLYGVQLGLGVGYEFWIGSQWSVGPLVRLHHTPVWRFNEFHRYDLRGGALLVDFTYH